MSDGLLPPVSLPGPADDVLSEGDDCSEEGRSEEGSDEGRSGEGSVVEGASGSRGVLGGLGVLKEGRDGGDGSGIAVGGTAGRVRL